MARGGTSWWSLIVSGLCGALVAGLVLVSTAVGTGGVRSASAQTATASSPAAPVEPRVAFIGDSWTKGYGATAMEGYAVLTGERLGGDYEVLGVGGSGYVAKGSGDPFALRIGQAVAFHPDVVVVQGSINEYRTDRDVLATAALRTLTTLRAVADPDTQILVLGASYVPRLDDATVAAINRTVGAAAAEVGLRFVDPAIQNWSDPDDPDIWDDPAHLNDLGARQVADHLVPLLREMVGG